MEKWTNLRGNLYPGDEFLTKERICVDFKNFDEYVNNEFYGDPHDKRLHIGLKPVPFIGNLKTASIYILTLNPGLNPSDYIQDETSEFKELHANNLNQKGNEDYPFYLLNPRLCSHAGYNYWTKKLKAVIEKIKNGDKVSWLEAQKKLSKKIAVLELIPYHSKIFRLDDKIINQLSSVRDIKNYAKDKIVAKARDNKCLLIIIRSSKRWDIKPEENIIVYSNPEARRGSLGENSKGYKEIIKFLGYDF